MKFSLFSIVLVLGLAGAAAAQPPGGRPAPLVKTGTVSRGMLAPTTEFKGTVYYKEVTQLAAEVEGKVLSVSFEEGDRLTAGDVLVELDHELVDADLAAARAAVRRAETAVKQEQLRFERAEEGVRNSVTTQQEFDDVRFSLEGSHHAVAQARAQVERLETVVKKKTIRAPYDCVVLDRQCEVGQWMESGATMAILAKTDLHDVFVNLPEQFLPFLTSKMPLEIQVLSKTINGRTTGGFPRGDLVTRTFPIKIRVENEPWLLQGMTALVAMPSGEIRECWMVSRDAMLRDGPQDYVMVLDGGQAHRVDVKVLGFQAFNCGVEAEGLNESTLVLVQGHEKLRDGQEVNVLSAENAEKL